MPAFDTAGMCELFRAAAPFYDADYAALNYNADVQFYQHLADGSGVPVLEMGCGTGRVLLPIARSGLEIHGLDLSGDMLAVLRKKLEAEPAEVQSRVSLTEGDMCTTDLGRKFGLIIAPFRSVQVLVSRDDQRAWLRNVRRHLGPGGALCFDVFQPNFSFLIEPRGPLVTVDRTDPATGVRVQRLDRIVPHNELQTMDLELEWMMTDASGAELSRHSGRTRMRWYTRGELENLLELEGFRITDYWGGFDRRPFGEGATDQVIRAV